MPSPDVNCYLLLETPDKDARVFHSFFSCSLLSVLLFAPLEIKNSVRRKREAIEECGSSRNAKRTGVRERLRNYRTLWLPLPYFRFIVIVMFFKVAFCSSRSTVPYRFGSSIRNAYNYREQTALSIVFLPCLWLPICLYLSCFVRSSFCLSRKIPIQRSLVAGAR